MTTVIIATRNRHKVDEIQAILGAGFRYLTTNEFPGAPEVQEDAGSFVGNATKKAVALSKWLAAARANDTTICESSSLVLADDSGLEVDALGGAPGVHSARFAALDAGRPDNSSAAENNAKLLRLLRDVPLEKRKARFRCVLALTPIPGPTRQTASPVCAADEVELQTELFEGVCNGHIDVAPRGNGGFGYDPLFIPERYDQTFGQLPEQLKNQLSHRALALAKLKSHLVQWSQTPAEHEKNQT
jgi:XTP/dITP diphosphohydrolase